jgi:hypothetical protein
VSRGARPCQMRVAPHSLLLLPTISRTVWSSWLLLIRESSRGAAGRGAATEDLAAPTALRGAMALGEGELRREDRRLGSFGCARSSEGRWWRRCAVERGRSLPCQAFKGGSQGAVSEAPALTRRFEKRPLPHYARPPRRFAPPTARVPRAHDLRFFTWSSDHAVDACRWRAQQLRGPPTLRFLKRARRGPSSRGLLSVFWILGYPGPPAPGPRHRSIFSPGENQRPKLRRKPSRGGAS